MPQPLQTDSTIRTRLAILLLLLCSALPAQNRDERISTQYAGPNAFPVPDMLDGRVSPALKAELAADYYHGFAKDRTADLFARLYIPLFTKRVNLTLWMPVCEWYEMTTLRQQQCLLQTEQPIRGHGAGDVYISTDMQLLVARRWWPDIALRAAMKTASGEQWFEAARHFDDPGYFFDLAVGKSLFITKEVKPAAERQSESDWELRLAASAGFLCWQTTTARQDDAYMYGVQLLVRQQYVSARVTWQGYTGWKRNGDMPMTLKAELRVHIKGFEPFACYQYGLRDYPFHQFRLGIAYNVDIIGRKSKDNSQKSKVEGQKPSMFLYSRK